MFNFKNYKADNQKLILMLTIGVLVVLIIPVWLLSLQKNAQRIAVGREAKKSAEANEQVDSLTRDLENLKENWQQGIAGLKSRLEDLKAPEVSQAQEGEDELIPDVDRSNNEPELRLPE